MHRQCKELWDQLPARVGLEQAQQFYDHVATSPGLTPRIGTSSVLHGKAGRPQEPGFSRTIHYEISGSGRVDYQYNDLYTGGAQGNPHAVVRILTIDLSSH